MRQIGFIVTPSKLPLSKMQHRGPPSSAGIHRNLLNLSDRMMSVFRHSVSFALVVEGLELKRHSS